MDDIKLYANKESDIDFLIHLTRIYINDIRMPFRLDKCGQMVSWRRRMMRTKGAELPEGNLVDVQDSYGYLGIPPANGSHEEAIWRSATAIYLQWERQVLKSQLNGKNSHRSRLSTPIPHQ